MVGETVGWKEATWMRKIHVQVRGRQTEQQRPAAGSWKAEEDSGRMR